MDSRQYGFVETALFDDPRASAWMQALYRKGIREMDLALQRLLKGVDEQIGDDVLVVVYGEFGRTPRWNDRRRGRDHWPGAFSAIMAGGGLKQGLVVGSTNPRGEYPADDPVTPEDLLATIYHVLGIDQHSYIINHAGRPVAILDKGRPIQALLA